LGEFRNLRKRPRDGTSNGLWRRRWVRKPLSKRLRRGEGADENMIRSLISESEKSPSKVSR
jgi:hypothetical protein